MNDVQNVGKWEYSLTIDGNANLCNHMEIIIEIHYRKKKKNLKVDLL